LPRNVLVISDLHLPFEHKYALEFCQRIQKEFNCEEEVVCIGDLVDNHSISYHEHDPDGWSPEDEMEQVDRKLQKWFNAFPKVKLCRGNHDTMVDRKGKTVGLPKRCFAQFRDIWGLPKGWVDDWEFEIGGVKYLHGTGYSGKNGHIQAIYDHRSSVVIGHLHSVAGVEYSANTKDSVFGLCVGCLVDRKAYAFDYGRDFKRKPILGAGVVSYTKRGTIATFVPMELR
jgi:predicted phosphodiesterase